MSSTDYRGYCILVAVFGTVAMCVSGCGPSVRDQKYDALLLRNREQNLLLQEKEAEIARLGEDRAERERSAREVADLKAREAQKEREQAEAEAAAAKERQEREHLAAELAAQKDQREKAAAEAAPTLSATGQRWAIVIGVSEYADTRIPALRYAAKDAKAFYDWLVSPDGGRYALLMCVSRSIKTRRQRTSAMPCLFGRGRLLKRTC